MPELKLASTAKEQLEVGMSVWAANYVVQGSDGQGRGLRRPGRVRQDDRPHLRERFGSAGDKKPDPATLYTNEFVGKLKLSDAEWAKAKAASAKYALG